MRARGQCRQAAVPIGAAPKARQGPPPPATRLASKRAVVARPRVSRLRSVAAAVVSLPSAPPPGTDHEPEFCHCDEEYCPAGVGELGWPVKAFSYVARKTLGKGTYGRVYLADDPCTRETVAVKAVPKTCPRGLPQCKKQLHILRNEVEIMQEMQGPHVVELKSVWEDERYAYIAMEVCDRGDLQYVIDQHEGPLPEGAVAFLANQVLMTVAKAHLRNICYSDIKPANFLLKSAEDSTGCCLELKLADFGCSQDLSDEEFLTERTGTPLYTAPEAFLGRYGIESDMWGVGMIIYRMLAGCYPFRANLDRVQPYAMMMSVLNDELKFDDAVWGGISPEARDLVSSMLARSPEKRITAEAALGHPWFSLEHTIPDLSTFVQRSSLEDIPFIESSSTMDELP